VEPSPANDFELRPRTIGALSKLLFRDNGGAGRMLCFADLQIDVLESGERSNPIVLSCCILIFADIANCLPSRFSTGRTSCAD
jgi:hypothetical protein